MWFSACSSITQNAAQTNSLAFSDLIRVEQDDPDDVLAWDVRLATSQALQKIAEQWGPLRQPVTVVVHRDHRALERALGKHDMPWLRAWARFDRVDLQSPKSFGFKNSYEKALTELLSHELTHVWTYQQLGERETWSRAWIPFWFREGMASWTAQQGYRRGTAASIGQKMQNLQISLDPLIDGEQLNRSHQPLAYAAAHWAFKMLIDEKGKTAVKNILHDIYQSLRCRNMASDDDESQNDASEKKGCSGQGSGFAQAFAKQYGESELAFAKRFKAHIEQAAKQAQSSGVAVQRTGSPR